MAFLFLYIRAVGPRKQLRDRKDDVSIKYSDEMK